MSPEVSHYQGDNRPLSAASVVAPETFILATRDTGYRDIASALAELVDNSVQAAATKILIAVDESRPATHSGFTVSVLDNGSGMAAETLRAALRFGGTNRFGSREGIGRFGMGLPNSSVSQARRLDVYSWQRPGRAYHTYLDVDAIARGEMVDIPIPQRSPLPAHVKKSCGPSGTLVVWSECDRLGRIRLPRIIAKLRQTLGRIYRKYLWRGLDIQVNAHRLISVDPLFVDSRAETNGGRPDGAPLRYEITTSVGRVSTVEVRFSELPLIEWAGLSDEEKRQRGIVGGGGASILRASREIDYGWYFMGKKRRENYDDWWRCEVSFSPELDELFGVTHNKQGINPDASLIALLGADLEPIARSLNARVRTAFQILKDKAASPSVTAASANDRFLPPPAAAVRRVNAGGLKYRLDNKPIAGPEFYSVHLRRGVVRVTMNSDHPFFWRVYRQLADDTDKAHRDVVERLLLAAARADLEAVTSGERRYVVRLRRAWGDALAAFLEVR
jgi:hypothetical protein